MTERSGGAGPGRGGSGGGDGSPGRDAPPRWALALLRRVAPPGRAPDLLGDLEEAHHARRRRMGRRRARLGTGADALEMAVRVAARRLLDRRTARSAPGPDRARSVVRARHGSPSFGVSLLDFKLGVRMLLKHPGLTAVAAVALGFVTAVGAGTLEFARDIIDPRIDLEESDRMVVLYRIDRASGNRTIPRMSDYLHWREGFDALAEIGATLTFETNLAPAGALGGPATGAAVTPSSFALPRIRPLLGRGIVTEDAAAGAPPVVVLGHDVWRARFDGDPAVLGREAALGGRVATVVGVMPDGFEWPTAHDFWVPLAPTVADAAAGDPGVQIHGRLAEGVELVQAEARLAGLAANPALADTVPARPSTPVVWRYGKGFFGIAGISETAFYSLNGLFFLAMVLVVSANVGLLVFARTATRERELVVRAALGAGRARIVGQLGVEALVLAALATGVGLAAAHLGLAWVQWLVREADEIDLGLPFWFTPDLSARTVLLALAVNGVGAILAGVLPALRSTGGALGAGLQRTGGGATAGIGRLWGAVIVCQVALTVLFMPVVLVAGTMAARVALHDPGFDASAFTTARMEEDARSDAALGRVRPYPTLQAAVRGLEEALLRRPDVTGVTLARHLPGTYHLPRHVEVDGETPEPESGGPPWARVGAVDPDFFEVLGIPVAAGRTFARHEGPGPSDEIVVNQAFVDEVLGGQNAVGRSLRYAPGRQPETGEAVEDTRWYRIVGVAGGPSLMVHGEESGEQPGIYHPLGADFSDAWLIMGGRGTPAERVAALRETAAAVDPGLRLEGLRGLDESNREAVAVYTAWFNVLLVAGALTLLLANAGIHAVLGLVVARRTREIGVRVALGARRSEIAATVLGRTLNHVGLGVVIGGVLLVLFVVAAEELVLDPSPRQLAIFLGYLGAMSAASLAAAFLPLRRALGIDPMHALKGEG